MTEPISMKTRFLFGSVGAAFWIGVVWMAAWSTSAAFVFALMVGLQVCGVAKYCGEKKLLRRTGLPACIGLPLDAAIGLYAIYIGGWMALAGALFWLTSAVELLIYGDIPSKDFTAEESASEIPDGLNN